MITFKVEIEREDGGRSLTTVLGRAGVLACGDTREDAISEGRRGRLVSSPSATRPAPPGADA